MRANINVEFTEEDLKKYAEEVGRRLVVNTIREVVMQINTVKLTPESLVNFKKMVVELARAAVEVSTPHEPHIAPPRVETVEPEVVHRGRPDKCQRVGEEPGMLDDGWICCRCGTYNGLHRDACRECKHDRCDVVVTPPPGTPSGSA